jgi:hypothetical protein
VFQEIYHIQRFWIPIASCHKFCSSGTRNAYSCQVILSLKVFLKNYQQWKCNLFHTRTHPKLFIFDTPRFALPLFYSVHLALLNLRCQCITIKWSVAYHHDPPMSLTSDLKVGLFNVYKACTKFGQNPLKDVDSRVFTRMLWGKKIDCDLWPWKSIGFRFS